MKVCIIAEGSYPYITGGVSSWIQMLITNMPDIEFVVYAIGPKKESKGKFSYKRPENIVEIIEVFMDTTNDNKIKYGKNFNLNKEESESIKSILTGNGHNWNKVFEIFGDNKIENINEFLQSKDLLNIIKDSYNENYNQTSFIDYFWNVKAMLLNFLITIDNTIPKADIYHCVSTGYAGIVGSYAKYLYNKPLILTEHGIYTREREEEIIKSLWVDSNFKDLWINYFYSLSKCIYDAADKIITLFNRNKEIQIEMGCNEKLISIIPNGVDVNSYADIDRKREDNNINIGSIIRMVPIKDIKTMISSFGIVKEKVKNVKFYIMGPVDEDEEYHQECLNLVKSLNIKGVIFTGKINIKKYIGKMDILVLTSISEGQPLAILEGMACEKPFVTTDVGSCRELIEGNDDKYGDAGIVCPVMDYESIAEGIIKLSMDTNLRSNMAKNAYNRVLNLYTREKFINAYINLYKELGA